MHDNQINEGKLVKMITQSDDHEIIRLGVISILHKGGTDLLKYFLEKYGESRSNDYYTENPIICEFMLVTKISVHDIEKKGLYIRFLDENIVYIGHRVTIFSGSYNHSIPIMEWSNLSNNK